MVKAGKLLPLILCMQGLFLLNAQTVYHTLQKGETLYSLSRQYDVSVQELIDLNDIESPESLSEGYRLIISTSSSQENDANPIEKKDFLLNDRYTVQKGDTFYRIARAHSMSVNELMSLNDFSGSSILKPGDILVVRKGVQSQVSPQQPEGKRRYSPHCDDFCRYTMACRRSHADSYRKTPGSYNSSGRSVSCSVCSIREGCLDRAIQRFRRGGSD